MKDRLTNREYQSVAALAEGRSYASVGAVLGISGKTAANHCQRAMNALGVYSQAGLVSWYWADKLKAASERIAQLEAQLNYSKTFPRHD